VRSFADIPVAVERLLRERHERVGVVLLDAFGRRFLQRHAGHPFLRRLDITELSAQFPSTTTAHVTTMHTGRPVGDHGLYEWNVYEPALDAIVTPLLFSFAGDHERDTLRATGLDPAVLVAGDTLYQRLAAAGVRSTVLHPAAFSPSTFDRVATAGARLIPFGTLRDGVAAFFEALAEPGYAYLYWDAIDAAGHVHGPDSREFDRAARGPRRAADDHRRPRAGGGRPCTCRLARRAVDGAAGPADSPSRRLVTRRLPAHRRRRRGDRRARRAPRRPRARVPGGRDRRGGPAAGRRLRAPGPDRKSVV
jgi:predicted AlkP superfamily pyrophosphatase or phosphodiesterase